MNGCVSKKVVKGVVIGGHFNLRNATSAKSSDASQMLCIVGMSSTFVCVKIIQIGIPQSVTYVFNVMVLRIVQTLG